MIDALRLDEWNDAFLDLATESARRTFLAKAEVVQQVVAGSNEIWVVRQDGEPVCLFGAWHIGSLVAPVAYVWVVPFETLRAVHVREVRKLFELWAESYLMIVAHVEPDRNAERFLEFFGFNRVDDRVYERRR